MHILLEKMYGGRWIYTTTKRWMQYLSVGRECYKMCIGIQKGPSLGSNWAQSEKDIAYNETRYTDSS